MTLGEQQMQDALMNLLQTIHNNDQLPMGENALQITQTIKIDGRSVNYVIAIYEEDSMP